MHCFVMPLCVSLLVSPALAGMNAPSTAPTYYWVFLETGSASRENLPDEVIQEMQVAHRKNLSRLRGEGKNLMAGPLGQESKSIRGNSLESLVPTRFAISCCAMGGPGRTGTSVEVS